jgi:tetratricopeptide (TPR) repeat protein
MIACGFGIFLVFTLPALLAPYYMTPQTFEHRLYLPFLGLLLVLPQTFFFKNKLTSQQLLNSFGALCFILALANFRHQQHFANPQAFWLQAVNSSPNSAYAHMMLAMQVEDKAKAHELFENAIRLNPREQHLNYNIGITLQKEDSLLASEKYLLKEKSITNYYLCGFHLAKVALAKNDIPSAVAYYSDFIKREPNTLPEEKAHILHNPLWQQPDSAKAFLVKTLRD